MNTLVKILCLFIVLPSVLMKSGPVYVSTEGETVKISCPYPDRHINTPKYFCRHPCKSSHHVLIKTVKHDQAVSDGRYSLIDSVNGRSFTVTIRHLRLTDSGYYYCGLDQWFKDTLKKVNLSVHQAPGSRSTHTPENTHITSTWTTTLTSAGSVTVVCAGVMLFLVFWIIVALVCIYSRRSDAKSRYTVQDPPDFNQAVDDVCTMVVYSLDDPPKEDCSCLNYSTTVYYCT
ncbi:CMRF35-like molecule 9 isoform X2 [Cyprinus carpio]|uniref:CMRF35-like molecule 9 isoform X2 n=1 Tax=Cyprinus carpio TaxID=7962 RepID=A0A9Q9WLV0_CYPCA|nr:CMRF35-like molecule 9 isoform X2 [Cyprinus carpio]